MAKYSAKEILDKYNKQKGKIRQRNGRIFKKIIRDHLTKELEELETPSKIEPDTTLLCKSGKRRIDLKINNKILIKSRAFGFLYDRKKDSEKYKDIKKTANEKNYNFLLITGEEYIPKNKDSSIDYRKEDINIIGEEYIFFLDDEKEDNWKKLIDRVNEILNIRKKSKI